MAPISRPVTEIDHSSFPFMNSGPVETTIVPTIQLESDLSKFSAEFIHIFVLLLCLSRSHLFDLFVLVVIRGFFIFIFAFVFVVLILVFIILVFVLVLTIIWCIIFRHMSVVVCCEQVHQRLVIVDNGFELMQWQYIPQRINVLFVHGFHSHNLRLDPFNFGPYPSFIANVESIGMFVYFQVDGTHVLVVKPLWIRFDKAKISNHFRCSPIVQARFTGWTRLAVRTVMVRVQEFFPSI
mmetsp:Transcript_28166/g.68564  ORF Transcript_28166/g.68564 Transcript_28166/m.68564 type:complete len:238 (-) Transcript_28166:807-1520(-)